MILLITGTPGTGKSTVSRLLAEKLQAQLVDVNQLVNDKHYYNGRDPQRGFKVVDIPALCQGIKEIIPNSKQSEALVIVEGHLSHFFNNADLVIVLRANPSVLAHRLEIRGFKQPKIQENVEAEAIDVCSFEAVEIHSDKVNEIDTSHKTPEEVVNLIVDVINGDKHFPVGKVDFLDYLYPGLI
jgi:adenylate kinase